MAEDDLPLPVEIPWKLASTTQPLAAGEPDETSISLFFFEPDDEVLTAQFPDQRLIYLKFTVSVSPATLPPGTPPVAALGEGVPCFHLRLDLKVRRSGGGPGTIRPYFHAAAPTHRTMVQTGVVGNDLFEGEADQQSIGKSGSQMHESSSSRSRTASNGAGLNLGIIGGSVRQTSTNVYGERAVSQVVDTTQRQASEERRELISHMTKVENVLTLLNAKYVGTPHLNFSLSPQPLALLSLDPSDPNLWFSQLLQRRSSGIEGIQEFTTLVFVPKGEDFCVNARLRRVCLLDVPPGPLTLAERFNFAQDIGRLINYLERVYPPGTPLDELDVDVTSVLSPAQDFPRPAVEAWPISGSGAQLVDVISPHPNIFVGVKRATVPYKTLLEAWLEALRDEYEREAARSPVERGMFLGENRFLDTCFNLTAAPPGGATVSGSTSSVSALFAIPIDPGELDLGGIKTDASAPRDTARARAFEAITRWNMLENRLATILGNLREVPRKQLRFDDDRVVGLIIDRWARLPVHDPRNLAFDQAAEALHLSDAHRQVLKSAGATDLRDIGQVIAAAPDIERHVERLALRPKAEEGDQPGRTLPAAIRISISSKQSAELRKAIGEALEKASAAHKRPAQE